MKRSLLLFACLPLATAALAQAPADSGPALQAPADKVAMPINKLAALKARLVDAAMKDTGIKLDANASSMSRLKKRGNDVATTFTAAKTTMLNGLRYKGIYMAQPWDGQLLGKATLTYDILLLGGNPDTGTLKVLGRKMTMEDKTCHQTWTFNFEAKAWELYDPATKELKDKVELGKEYPCHVHVNLVPIYDNRTGPLMVGEDGRVRHSRYTTVLRKYITSAEDFTKIRELWLDRKIYTKEGEIVEVKPSDDPR